MGEKVKEKKKIAKIEERARNRFKKDSNLSRNLHAAIFDIFDVRILYRTRWLRFYVGGGILRTHCIREPSSSRWYFKVFQIPKANIPSSISRTLIPTNGAQSAARAIKVNKENRRSCSRVKKKKRATLEAEKDGIGLLLHNYLTIFYLQLERRAPSHAAIKNIYILLQI